MRFRLGIVCSVLGMACALRDPTTVRASFAPRESSLIDLRTIQAEDQWFAAKVPAKPDSSRVAYEDDQYRIVLDIGAESPVECSVSKDWRNPPWFLREFYLGFFRELDGEAVESSEIVGVDAGAVEGAIYMGAEWDLTVRTWMGTFPGSLHMLYGVKQDASIACFKYQIGYRETFIAVFRALVESFEISEPPQDPDFSEISVLSIEGRRVGLSVETVRRDEEGDRKHEMQVHMLVPVGPDSLFASSRYQLEWVDALDRSLLSTYLESFENDDQISDLSLAWSAERTRWVASGTHRGVEIDEELDPGLQPTSQLELVRATREMLAEPEPKGRILTTWVWSDVDPTRLAEATLRIDEVIDAERARATLAFEAVTSEMIVERATGRAVSVNFRTPDGHRVDVERVHVEGAE